MRNFSGEVAGLTGTFAAKRKWFNGPDFDKKMTSGTGDTQKTAMHLAAIGCAASSLIWVAASSHDIFSSDSKTGPTTTTVASAAPAETGISAPITEKSVITVNSGAITQAPTTTAVERGTCEIEVLPIAKKDSHGMKQIQAAIKELGFDPGPIDGDQGAQTVAALNSWKLANNFATQQSNGKIVSERFNYAMCAVIPSLNDGNPATPAIP
jgi:hypothetical protein